MSRCSGWVEVVAPRGRRPRSAARARALARIRVLVDVARAAGCPVVLGECDGRLHLWIDATADDFAGLLPFLKAVGAAAPHSYGVLDLADGSGLERCWVMREGSLDPVRQADPRPTGQV